MLLKFRTWWQRITRHWRIASVVILLALLGVFVLGYWLNWHWTGLVSETSEPKQHAKTLWDWLQLLIVPVFLAIGGFWLSKTQKDREEQLAQDKQREDLLQNYLDHMSALLLEKKLRSSRSNAEVRKVARARTISVLRQLDGNRVSIVFTFLWEAGLMLMTTKDDVVSLKGADFNAVNWRYANLSQANLGGANLEGANLSGASLHKAILSRANLTDANLSEAWLADATLNGALLSRADLFQAFLSEANLSNSWLDGANLSKAQLLGVDLSETLLDSANLSGADLSSANLSKADTTNANFSGAYLSDTNLNETHLDSANLSGADLSSANLSKANLYRANLKKAQLWGANLSDVLLEQTILTGARYNSEEIEVKRDGNVLYKIPPTQWSQGFDPKAAGAIEDNTPWGK